MVTVFLCVKILIGLLLVAGALVAFLKEKISKKTEDTPPAAVKETVPEEKTGTESHSNLAAKVAIAGVALAGLAYKHIKNKREQKMASAVQEGHPGNGALPESPSKQTEKGCIQERDI